MFGGRSSQTRSQSNTQTFQTVAIQDNHISLCNFRKCLTEALYFIQSELNFPNDPPPSHRLEHKHKDFTGDSKQWNGEPTRSACRRLLSVDKSSGVLKYVSAEHDVLSARMCGSSKLDNALLETVSSASANVALPSFVCLVCGLPTSSGVSRRFSPGRFRSLHFGVISSAVADHSNVSELLAVYYGSSFTPVSVASCPPSQSPSKCAGCPCGVVGFLAPPRLAIREKKQ